MASLADLERTWVGPGYPAPCSSPFVQCARDAGGPGIRVVAVRVSRRGLSGTIPDSLTLLRHLTQVDLSDNAFNAGVPASLSSLDLLVAVNLSLNALSGPLLTGPALRGRTLAQAGLTALESLDAHNNQLSGSIPGSIASLTALTHLDLSNNELSGSIPGFLETLTRLRVLRLQHNLFEGVVSRQLAATFSCPDAFDENCWEDVCPSTRRRACDLLHTAPVLSGGEVAAILLCGSVALYGLASWCRRLHHQRRQLKRYRKIRSEILTALSVSPTLPGPVQPMAAGAPVVGVASTREVIVAGPTVGVGVGVGAAQSDPFTGAAGVVPRAQPPHGREVQRGGQGIYQIIELNGVTVGLKQVATPATHGVTRAGQRALERALELEAWALQQLQHPNIVRVFMFSPEPPLLVMEHCSNGSLSGWVKAQKYPLTDPTEAISLCRDVAAGMKYLHEAGFIHCDLAPSNVLLKTDGGKVVAVVADLGLAVQLPWTLRAQLVDLLTCGSRSGERQQWIQLGRRGTPQFMAPEMLTRMPPAVDPASCMACTCCRCVPACSTCPHRAACNRRGAEGMLVSPKADVYSFGILMTVVFGGRLEWPEPLPADKELSKQAIYAFIRGGERPRTPSKAPARIIDLINACCQQEPSRRPPFAEILTILTEIGSARVHRSLSHGTARDVGPAADASLPHIPGGVPCPPEATACGARGADTGTADTGSSPHSSSSLPGTSGTHRELPVARSAPYHVPTPPVATVSLDSRSDVEDSQGSGFLLGEDLYLTSQPPSHDDSHNGLARRVEDPLHYTTLVRL